MSEPLQFQIVSDLESSRACEEGRDDHDEAAEGNEGNGQVQEALQGQGESSSSNAVGVKAAVKPPPPPPHEVAEEASEAGSKKQKTGAVKNNVKDSKPCPPCICCDVEAVAKDPCCAVHKATVACIQRQLKWQSLEEQQWVKSAKKNSRTDKEQRWVQLILRVEAKCPSLGERTSVQHFKNV